MPNATKESAPSSDDEPGPIEIAIDILRKRRREVMDQQERLGQEIDRLSFAINALAQVRIPIEPLCVEVTPEVLSEIEASPRLPTSPTLEPPEVIPGASLLNPVTVKTDGPRSRRRWTDAQKKHAVRLADEYKSVSQAADEVGCHRAQIDSWRRLGYGGARASNKPVSLGNRPSAPEPASSTPTSGGPLMQCPKCRQQIAVDMNMQDKDVRPGIVALRLHLPTCKGR